ncbi:MAG: Tad domain-containing protein [Candidatus Omnitrophica bacterium]|nr:Tad domain-containing protein [Candidatus Omnitrophota bacterium]
MLKRTEKNRGTIIVLFLVLITVMMFMIAFAVDVGYVYTTKSELQHAADSAALAAMWELKDQTDPNLELNAKARALEYGTYNPAAEVDSLTVDEADVHIGFMDDPFNINKELNPFGPEINTVEVFVKRSHALNGALALFVGGITGTSEVQLQAKARAFITDRVIGFDSAPGQGGRDDDGGDSSEEGGGESSSGGNSGMADPKLWPFTIHYSFWNKYYEAQESYAQHYVTSPYDDPDYPYTIEYENIDGEIITVTLKDELMLVPLSGEEGEWEAVSGSDGKLEMDMYPLDTGSSGNYGTIDIGDENNSANDLKRQIAYGVSDEDLEKAGGQFALDSDDFAWVDSNGNGLIDIDEEYKYELVDGDTGISWSIKNAILGKGEFSERLIGDPFILTIFNGDYNKHDLGGDELPPDSKEKKPTGENLVYQIVGFATIEIVDVVKGGDKGIIVQASGYQFGTPGGSGDDSGGSGDYYSNGSGYDVSGSAIIGFDGPTLPNSSLFVFGLTR